MDIVLRSLKIVKKFFKEIGPKKAKLILKIKAKCVIRLEGKTPFDAKSNQEVSKNFTSHNYWDGGTDKRQKDT